MRPPPRLAPVSSRSWGSRSSRRPRPPAPRGRDAGLAARVSDDPDWRGTALYAAGRYAEAAQAFSKSPYNRGNALARAGELKGALAAYEAALARDPSDEDAKANRELSRAPPRHAGRPRRPHRRPGERQGRRRHPLRHQDRIRRQRSRHGVHRDGLAGHRESSSAADSPGIPRLPAPAGPSSGGRSRPRPGPGSASDAEGGGRRGGGNASVSEVVERECGGSRRASRPGRSARTGTGSRP